VFAGPCTAKIHEVDESEVKPWVDAAITFEEVEKIIFEHGVDPRELVDEEFDPPHSYLGGLFPMGGGLIRVAGLPADLFQNCVTHVEGRAAFRHLITKLNQSIQEGRIGELQTRFFDVLFCQGCIDGPVMPGDESRLRRKERIVEYLHARRPIPRSTWEAAMRSLSDLDLSRAFTPDPQVYGVPEEEEIRRILERTNKFTPDRELNCGACGYKSCREKAIAVWNGMAEVEMCLPYMIEKLEAMVTTLHESYAKLTETQTQLIRTERLASMGQMAAGIAHEVNNPLGTILIYSHLLREHEDLADTMKPDIDRIIGEAIRCKNIVGGLLDFARQSQAHLLPVSLSELLEKAAETTRAQIQDLPIQIVVSAAEDLPQAQLDWDQMLQVLLNLMRNSVDAMPNGGTIAVSAAWREASREFVISVRDQGAGIPPEHLEKHIFTPFFSTKAVGKGTGLGLSICYGIVKMHRGQIVARNHKDGPGCTFEITLPDSSSESPEEKTP
jgi:signal transduction histidine kinase